MIIKEWIKNRCVSITDGYSTPIGRLETHIKYVNFVTFSMPLDEVNKYNSLEELLEENLKWLRYNND